jgi:hypothetical protein
VYGRRLCRLGFTMRLSCPNLSWIHVIAKLLERLLVTGCETRQP